MEMEPSRAERSLGLVSEQTEAVADGCDGCCLGGAGAGGGGGVAVWFTVCTTMEETTGTLLFNSQKHLFVAHSL